MALILDELVVGQEFEDVVVENLTRTQIVQYAGASGDFNPLHTDEIFATSVARYDSTIAHGMLTMGMTGHLVTDLVGDGQLVNFGGRFVGVVRPGDTLTANATIVEISALENASEIRLSITTSNQHGDDVFVGYATSRVTS